MNNNIDVAIANIISTVMSIPETRVVCGGQDFDIPTDDDLFVVIYPDVGGNTVISNTKSHYENTSTGEFTELRYNNSVENFVIEITSKNRDALNRKEEVLMALISDYSSNVQAKNGFRINRTNKIIPVPSIEPASLLYRFLIPIKVFNSKTIEVSADYYDKYREASSIIKN